MTSGQLTATTKMSSRKASDDRKRFLDAARYAQLKDILELSSKLSNDVRLVSDALIRSYAVDDHYLDVVKYLVETCHTDINLYDSIGNTSLIMVCRYVKVSVSMYLLGEVPYLGTRYRCQYSRQIR